MRILFLTHRLPYAPNRGDRVRAFHLLREMARWAEVDLVSLVHDDDEASHVGDLRDVTTSITTARVSRFAGVLRAAIALPSPKPTTHSLLQAPSLPKDVADITTRRQPDLVFAYCTGVAPLAFLPTLRDVPVVLDMVDVDSAKWAALAKASGPPLSWIYSRESRVLRQFELDVATRARFTLVVTEAEKATLAQIAPDALIHVVANGVDGETLRRPDTERSDGPTVVFCGVMNYAPNVEGANWLVRSVWPIVRQRRGDARLEIVGSHPTRAVRELADSRQGVVVTGQVPDVRPHLWRAAISVAPLLTARGVQNKVLEAVAAGLPTVVTSVVSEGLPREVQVACFRTDGATQFAEAILALLERSPEERRDLASKADIAALSWDRRLASIKDLLTAARASPYLPRGVA